MSFLQSINANGIKLSFVEKGTGQPVVLVHGFPLITEHGRIKRRPYQRISER